jgi:hypothetical protein
MNLWVFTRNGWSWLSGARAWKVCAQAERRHRGIFRLLGSWAGSGHCGVGAFATQCF